MLPQQLLQIAIFFKNRENKILWNDFYSYG